MAWNRVKIVDRSRWASGPPRADSPQILCRVLLVCLACGTSWGPSGGGRHLQCPNQA